MTLSGMKLLQQHPCMHRLNIYAYTSTHTLTYMPVCHYIGTYIHSCIHTLHIMIAFLKLAIYILHKTIYMHIRVVPTTFLQRQNQNPPLQSFYRKVNTLKS